jgi:hypothetical protein
MATLPRIARALPLVLPLALVAPMAVLTPADATAGDKDQPEYDYGAKVTIELRMEDGTIVKHRGELRSFGTDWRFEFEGGDHRHVVTLSAEGEEGKKTLDVTIAYERDATAIIAPFKDTYTARKRQAFWTEDGSLAVALTFYPTKFEREDQSRDDKEKINPDDSDDPLGGNLFK